MKLIHEPKAHTDGDIIVFFRGSDVVVTGDVFRTDSYPVIDPRAGRDARGRAGRAQHGARHRRSGAEPDGRHPLIPGHGRIWNEADVLEYRDMLTIIRDRVRDMMKKGMTLEQVKAAKPTLEYDGFYGSRRN